MVSEMSNGNEAQRPGERAIRPATRALRQVLETSEEFEVLLQRRLTVNPTDLKAMEHLIQSGPLGATELARRIGVSSAATTAVVDRLVAVGHATRVPNPEDRRGVVIVPKPESVARAMAALMPMILGIDAVLDEFGERDQGVITSYLERVLEVYREQLRE